MGLAEKETTVGELADKLSKQLDALEDDRDKLVDAAATLGGLVQRTVRHVDRLYETFRDAVDDIGALEGEVEELQTELEEAHDELEKAQQEG